MGPVWKGLFFFFNDTATTKIYTLSLHDALPISGSDAASGSIHGSEPFARYASERSEEHTSELQSRENLVCRLLLEKKNRERRARRATEQHARDRRPRADAARSTRRARPPRSPRHAHRPPRPGGALFFFFFNDTATTEIYTLSLHDALPI